MNFFLPRLFLQHYQFMSLQTFNPESSSDRPVFTATNHSVWSKFREHHFAYVGPEVWNTPLSKIPDLTNLNILEQKLKTFLFTELPVDRLLRGCHSVFAGLCRVLQPLHGVSPNQPSMFA